jgi:hypothetical protein
VVPIVLHVQAILFMQMSADKKDSLHTRHDPNADFPVATLFLLMLACF